MESSMVLDTVKMAVSIEEIEGEQDTRIVNFHVKDLGDIKIELSNSDVNDIKDFYDKVFEYIILEKKLIKFQLEHEKNNLFSEVANDIIEHLNNEITQSEQNFIKLIELKDGTLRSN